MPIGTPNSAAALHHISYLPVATQNGGRLKATPICITSIDLTSTIFQANGLDEQWNETLKNMVVKYAHEKKKDWDMYLDSCLQQIKACIIPICTI